MAGIYASYPGGGNGGGVTSIGLIDSQTPSSNGAVIAAQQLILQSASATVPGLVNNTTQTFSGVKTFSSPPNFSSLTASTALVLDASHNVSTAARGTVTEATSSVLTLSGWTNATFGSPTIQVLQSGSSQSGYLSSTDWNTFNNKQSLLTLGNLTDAGTDGITITNGTGAVVGSGTSISQHVADTTHNGYLSSTDWNTFNGKQAAGNYLTALTGDATATGPGSVALTLVTVNANVGSFGSSTAIPNFTVNAKGLITAAATSAVVAPAGTLSGTTLNSTVVSSSLTSVGTIATGVWNGTAIAIANGGTGQVSANAGFNALSPMTTGGDLIYGGASGVATRLANGSANQVLTSAGGTAAPTWSNPVQNITVTSQSTTYNILTTDYLILCSGASFTVTLPTASGVTGKRYVIKHVGTSLSQAYTINTTSGQTVGGIASGSYILTTNQESLEIVSDGSNWQILDHFTNTISSSYSLTIAGTSGNPSQGSGATNTAMWSRDGQWMDLIFFYSQTAPGSAGTGTYLFPLPVSTAINTGVVNVGASAIGTSANVLGRGQVSNTSSSSSASASDAAIFGYDSTHLFIVTQPAATQLAPVSSTNYSLSSNPTYYTFSARIPIVNWQP